MARGKYATRAESAHVRETALQEVARLRRENARLAADVDRLDRENLEQQAAHLDEVGRLRRMIAGATSEQVAQLQAQLDTAKRSIREAEQANRDVRESHDKTFNRIVGHFVEVHGLTGTEAVQHVATGLGFEGYIVDDIIAKTGLSTEAAARIDQARGRVRPGRIDIDTSKPNREARPW